MFGSQVVIAYALHHRVNMSYMYDPIVQTLLQGFRFLNVSVQLRVINERAPTTEATHQLQTRNTFVWIGPFKAREIEWSLLRRRGIRTIFYQTEPVTGCFLTQADELWDYSPSNVRHCKKQNAKMVVRHVPVGFYKTAPVVDFSSKSLLSTAVFLGARHLRPTSCWKHQPNVSFRRDVWCDLEFARVLQKHYLFLNVHKACGRAQNPVAIRVPMLVQSLGMVVSEIADAEDMRLYEDITDFTTNTQRMMDLWASRLVEDVESEVKRRLEIFKARFEISKIFGQFHE